MKRRDFLKLSGMASAAMTMNGMPLQAFGQNSFLSELAKTRATNGNILVLIQLSGGNDGLNMVIPVDRYTELSAARPNLLIPQSAVLGLNGIVTNGLHPAMTGLQNMYNNGLVNIVQGVSYPNPNFSHFRSTDIWQTASDANTYLDTGWLGRMIDNQFPGAPQAYPDPNFLHPLAIQIGSTVSPMLSGVNGINGLAVSSISSFYNIITGQVDPAPATPAGNELTFIRFIQQQTQAYTQIIQNAAGLGTNMVTYPGSRLAQQLQMVAKLISGGLQTPIYVVTQGGYDTHDNQVDTVNVTNGQHAVLLGDLSDAIAAFQSDLQLLGKDDIVAGCTFSEFGRRIKSNASLGSDHGSAAPMIVFGKNVNPTMIGTSPVLPASATVSDNVPMQHDFRQVYSSILQDWFKMTLPDTQAVLNGVNYSTLPIFKNTISNPPVVENPIIKNIEVEQNFPNPFIEHTTIRFKTPGGAVQINLYDAMGRKVRVLYENDVPQGAFEVNVDRGNLRAGIYYYEFIQGSYRMTKSMMVK